MNTIEEQLWNYIDGNCSLTEKAEIKGKIATDLQFSATYKELLAFQRDLDLLELEEPSMSFTRNVMDKVNLELKPVALKTKVDQRIIYGIAGFFLLAIVAIVGFAISMTDLSLTFKLPQVDFSIYESKLINPTSIKIFVMLDIVLALLYLDSFLRKRNNTAEKKGV